MKWENVGTCLRHVYKEHQKLCRSDISHAKGMSLHSVWFDFSDINLNSYLAESQNGVAAGCKSIKKSN